MKLNDLKEKALPHVLAVIVFLVITCIFYFPLIFEGKELNQNDINQGIASASEVVEFREKTGEEALWTNSMFGGMPAYLINVKWSGSVILTTIEKVISFGLPGSARETFISLVCFYFLLIVFGVRPTIAVAGAIAYAFSSFFIVSIEAGHLWKVRAIAYAPLVLAGIHLVYQRKYLVGFVVAFLAMALEINSNHIQIFYYLVLNIVVYGIVQLYFAFRANGIVPFLKASAFVVLATILGIGANLGKIWSTYEYGKYSIRGKSDLTSNSESKGGLDRDYAFQWSAGIGESFTFLVPNYFGGASGQYNGEDSELEKTLLGKNVPKQNIEQYTRGLLGYWGPQPFTSGPVYAGAVICFLFVFGLIYVDPKYKWWLVTATIFSFMLSWGKNFSSLNYFLFDYLPLYNKFRAVTMTIFIALTNFPLLACLGLEAFIKQEKSKDTYKKLLIAAGSVVGMVALLALIAYVPSLEGDQFPVWLKDAVRVSRKSVIRMDAFRSFIFISLAFGVLYLWFKNKIKAQYARVLIAVLIAIDILAVDHRYLNSENYINKRKNNFFTETPADKAIAKDSGPNYRVLNLQGTFQEARTSVFHKSIGGYHGAKMRRYQELIDHYLQKEISEIIGQRKLTGDNTQVLNMLNTKYILAGLSEDAVIKNPYNNGDAWFISSMVQVDNADDEMAKLGEINIKQEGVIDISKFKASNFEYDSLSSVSLVSYKPNKLEYESNSAKDGFVVFSEIYYPKGWKAYIDGKESDIKRVNYVLRGLNVPSGKHKITFEFKPAVYAIGDSVMWVSSVLLILLLLLVVYQWYNGMGKQDFITEAKKV